MKYLVLVDSQTPAGMLLLSMLKKIGGASDVVTCGVTPHPAIYCSAIDWGSAPSFVRLTHLANPPDQDSARELVVPHTCILAVMEMKAPSPTDQPPQSAGIGPVKH